MRAILTGLSLCLLQNGCGVSSRIWQLPQPLLQCKQQAGESSGGHWFKSHHGLLVQCSSHVIANIYSVLNFANVAAKPLPN